MQMLESLTTALHQEFGTLRDPSPASKDGIETIWADREQVPRLLRFLKTGVNKPYRMLYDLTAIDERMRKNRLGDPESDFTVVYHLFSYDRNEYVRVKVPLKENALSIDTVTDLWPSANWYER